MKRFVLSFALTVGLLTSASTLQAQTVNMSRYITLTVTNGAEIKLNFMAAAAGTPVRIVSGSNTQNITVGTNWYDSNSPSTFTVTAGDTEMTIYGDITGFNCRDNGANLTALDPSHNTQLTWLYCSYNNLSNLDISHNTQLEALFCSDNNLSNLYVGECTLLKKLGCSNNPLGFLNVSENTQLTGLYCSSNNLIDLYILHNTQLTELDCSDNNLNILNISHNTQLERLNCNNNQLTALNVSHNTQLRWLYCYDNNFSTVVLDNIFCALPIRQASDNAVIQPIYDSSSSDTATVAATNAQNATSKNWKVQYYRSDTDIPATTGTYVCGTPHTEPNMSRYITLTVANGAAIRLNFQAAVAGTPVRIVSGSNTQDITVGTSWYDNHSPSTFTVTAAASTMTVYGDIVSFSCNENGANLTALDPSHNTLLAWLYCHYNSLSDLDVSQNTKLMGVVCGLNNLSSLDLSQNTNLMGVVCGNNNLSSLDLSQNTQLTELSCDSNRLSALDVSHNTQLEWLNCNNNQLTALDVSQNTKLKKLYCGKNNFTTAALDDIYCALPDRNDFTTYGLIYPIYDSSSPDTATVAATNAQNATSKKWVVLYYENSTNISATTGTYVCGTPHPEPNMSRYITLTVKKDSAIRLDFMAAAAGTPVRIVSGSTTRDITVGTNWTNFNYYTAGDTTMTIYGDLTGFSCSENKANLTALDVSHNTQLTKLYCRVNNLNSLDVSHNTQLKELYCVGNQLTDLDVSHNTQLRVLYCYRNTLNSIDVSHNTQLKKLYCHSNNLSSLDVSQNTQLKVLSCGSNNFTTAALDDIYCALPNRNDSTNGVIYPIYSSSSSDTATVKATNKANAISKNWKVQYHNNKADIPPTTGTYVCGTPHPEPEPNMSRYITLTVKKDSAIWLDLQAAAAGTLVRIVSGSTDTIVTVGADWTGFNYYTASDTTMTIYGDLTGLDCSENEANLTYLDISHNTQLEKLYCNRNQLTDLDVSHNTQLTELYCYGNNLDSLDVSHNTQLTWLNCSYNDISALDVSHNTQLKVLCCHSNNFTTAALDDIYCALPNRNDSTNGVIYPIYSSSSSDTATVKATNKANAISKNWKVQYHNNKADIPPTTGTYVCGTPHPEPEPNMSRYITLTVKKDSAIRLDFMAAAAGTPVRIVSGSNTQNITVGTDWYNGNSPSTYTVTADASTMTVYGDLTSFDCQQNGVNLTALDVSHNTQLKVLYCVGNQLTDLDVSQNTQLTKLYCRVNNLDSLDVSHNTQLKVLYCVGNQLTDLDVSQNTQLTWLGCDGNTLSRLDVSHNTQLKELNCGSNPLTDLDVSHNTQLKVLDCGRNQLTDLDVSHNTQLEELRCYSNNLNSLDVSQNTQLTWLGCDGNNLSSLDLSHNTQLKVLWCGYNNLNSLDVSQNTQLTELYCYDSNLSSLDVSHNTQLTELYCSDNQLTSLDVSQNTQLKVLYCGSNNFTTAALDDIYCSLPDRTGSLGYIYPLKDSSDPNLATVKATNKANAISQNWKVRYYDNSDITTNGTYECGTPHTDIADVAIEPTLTLYPNPVADVLYLSATARTIRIYDMYGIEVAHATNTDKVEVSHLPAGIYTVRADGMVAKMVKR